MSIICPVCSSSESQVVASFRGVHPAFAGLDRAYCGNCGLFFASPMPLPAVLNEYNANYYSSAHGGPAINPVSQSFFSGIAKLRLEHIESYCEANSVQYKNILEIGPGFGYLAKEFIERKPFISYSAVETDTTCHAALEKLSVELIPADQLNTRNSKYDLIIMSHVLEHISTPLDYLASSANSLRSGGVIFIEVPCHDFVHKELDEPHVLFFDKDSLGYLLNILGLENIQLTYHGKTLDTLKRNAGIPYYWSLIRSRLISSGVVFPFARSTPGLETVQDPLQRAAVKPYLAHLEQEEPSWWLRAIAMKR